MSSSANLVLEGVPVEDFIQSLRKSVESLSSQFTVSLQDEVDVSDQVGDVDSSSSSVQEVMQVEDHSSGDSLRELEFVEDVPNLSGGRVPVGSVDVPGVLLVVPSSIGSSLVLDVKLVRVNPIFAGVLPDGGGVDDLVRDDLLNPVDDGGGSDVVMDQDMLNSLLESLVRHPGSGLVHDSPELPEELVGVAFLMLDEVEDVHHVLVSGQDQEMMSADTTGDHVPEGSLLSQSLNFFLVFNFDNVDLVLDLPDLLGDMGDVLVENGSVLDNVEDSLKDVLLGGKTLCLHQFTKDC